MLQWKQNSQGKSALITTKSIVNYKLLFPGGPIPHNMAKTALVRQPYSVAVPSTGGRLHPLPFWKGRGLGSGLRTLPQGFLSPTRGTERVVKTIEDRWGKYSTKGGFPLLP